MNKKQQQPRTFSTITIGNNKKKTRSICGLIIGFAASMVLPQQDAMAAQAPVGLGMAGNYAILAKSGISTVPASAVTGNMGVSPIASTAITGFSLILDSTTQFSRSSQVVGKVYAASYASPTPANLTTAVSDMQTAYTAAAGRTLPNFTELGAGNIGGKTLAPGLYKWGTGVTIPTDVTLSGGPNDVWIFQIAGNLTIAGGKRVVLSGGAQAKNIFWQVAGGVGVDLGTTSHFEGIILAKAAIHLRTRASINGKLLAQTAVTLDANTVRDPNSLPPSAPMNLKATALAPNRVSLSWKKTSTNVSGFTIARSMATNGPFVSIINVNSSATNYLDQTVHSGLRYYYVVKAYNSFSSSGSSLSAGVTLPVGLTDNLVFQNTNGQFSIWVMNQTNFVRYASITNGPKANTGWRVVAFADFNSDYNADILWQNYNGQLMTWLMKSTNVLRSVPLRTGSAASTGWKVVGAPDVTGDGKPDFLWHNSNGGNLYWQMNGTNYVKSVYLRKGHSTGTGWNVLGAIDLDGNSNADILWSNTNGMNSAWLMNRTNYLKSVPLRTGYAASTGWKNSVRLDLNADRKMDFVWEKNDGRLEGWLMNRTNYIRSVTLRTNTAASSGWRLVGPR